jgi:uncharacterized membrane protein YpjA
MASLTADDDETAAGAARRDWVAFFGAFKTAPGWAVLVALVNLVGIAYGFYYYLEQFAITPAWLWPFVPDSPLAVLWAQLALLGYWLHRRRRAAPTSTRAARPPGRWLDALDALAWVGNAQVGLWTVYVLVVYADRMGTWNTQTYPGGFEGPSLNAILLVGHAAMVGLGLLFLHGLRTRIQREPRRLAWALGVPLAYYLVNDALDYFGPDFLGRGCGLRPITVPCDPALEGALAATTFGLTLATSFFLMVVVRPRRTDADAE